MPRTPDHKSGVFSEDHFDHTSAYAHIIPPAEILSAYRQGYFPMAVHKRADADVFWYTARERGIIPLDDFHMPRRSLKYFRKYGFGYSINHDFRGVIEGCADRDSSWINPVIRDTFLYLHEHEIAHSVEVWKDEVLIGGLYGLALGGVFFAESMFQYHDEGHKAAMYYCHKQLQKQDFSLWDVQFYTNHLGRFGCTEISGARYRRLLNEALKQGVSFT